jgi:hypothetical protein
MDLSSKSVRLTLPVVQLKSVYAIPQKKNYALTVLKVLSLVMSANMFNILVRVSVFRTDEAFRNII